MATFVHPRDRMKDSRSTTAKEDAEYQDGVLMQLEHTTLQALMAKQMPIYALQVLSNGDQPQHLSFRALLIPPLMELDEDEDTLHAQLHKHLLQARLVEHASRPVTGIFLNDPQRMGQSFVPFVGHKGEDMVVIYLRIKINPPPDEIHFDPGQVSGISRGQPFEPVTSYRHAPMVAVVDFFDGPQPAAATTKAMSYFIGLIGACRPRSLTLCWNCEGTFAPRLQKKCACCRVALYCSKECQTQHWSAKHRAGECKLLRSFF